MNSHFAVLRPAAASEIDARLEEVESASGSCAGHPALARAIGTLLRCQRAQLNERAAGTAVAARTGGIAGALLVGLIEAVKQAWGK